MGHWLQYVASHHRFSKERLRSLCQWKSNIIENGFCACFTSVLHEGLSFHLSPWKPTGTQQLVYNRVCKVRPPTSLLAACPGGGSRSRSPPLPLRSVPTFVSVVLGLLLFLINSTWLLLHPSTFPLTWVRVGSHTLTRVYIPVGIAIPLHGFIQIPPTAACEQALCDSEHPATLFHVKR